MVSESYSDVPSSDIFGRYYVGGPDNRVEKSIPGHVSKQQTGYRSGPLSQEQEIAIEGKADLWANVVTRLDALDQGYEYTGKASRQFMVNDRDYSATSLSPALFEGRAAWRNDPENLFSSGLIPTSVDSGIGLPDRPSDSQLSSTGGKLLRKSAPSHAEINLARIIGEQKDAPRLFRAANYVPKNPKEAAGSYLNWLFGVRPTASDIKDTAETVTRLDPLLRRYLRQETVRVRRTRSTVTDEANGSGSLPRSYGMDEPFHLGPVHGVSHYLVPGTYAGFNDTVMVDGVWSWTAQRSVSSFATWEYFIPRPEGLSKRLSKYNQLAHWVLGLEVTPSLVYDLTPWSWMVNWFVDIGGLLRYQQAVADNQLVMIRGGYSVWEELNWSASIRDWYYAPNPGDVGLWPTRYQSCTPASAHVRTVRHVRRKGSPYSISPTWSLSNQQWAIAGALGIARSHGVPT